MVTTIEDISQNDMIFGGPLYKIQLHVHARGMNLTWPSMPSAGVLTDNNNDKDDNATAAAATADRQIMIA